MKLIGIDPGLAACGVAIVELGRVPRVLSLHLGRVRGLLDAFAVERALPIIEETAQTLKLLTTGKRDASKAEVQTALELRFPEVKALWPTQKTLQEHAAVAHAAVVAGLESDVVRAALRARGYQEQLGVGAA